MAEEITRTLHERSQGIMDRLKISGELDDLDHLIIDMTKVFEAGGNYVIDELKKVYLNSTNPLFDVINKIRELRGDELTKGYLNYSKFFKYELITREDKNGFSSYIKYKKHFWSKWKICIDCESGYYLF